MLNQIVLIGKIKGIEKTENKNEVILEVERPFQEDEIRKSDVFVCRLWSCIFNGMLSLCAIGDLVAIKGRVNYEEEKYIINAENVVLLNKSKENILKL